MFRLDEVVQLQLARAVKEAAGVAGGAAVQPEERDSVLVERLTLVLSFQWTTWPMREAV